MSDCFNRMQHIAETSDDEVRDFANILDIEYGTMQYVNLVYILGAVRLDELNKSRERVRSVLNPLSTEVRNNILPLVEKA